MHDPSVLRKDVKFFERLNTEADDGEEEEEEEAGEGADAEGSEQAKAKKAKAKTKKTTYKDLVRESILKKMHKDDADADADSDDSDDDTQRQRRAKSGLSIAEEERLAREEFLRAAGDSDEESEEEEGMLRKRVKSAAEREAEENEYKQFLESRKAQDKALLEKFWIEKSDADPSEKFLRECVPAHLPRLS